MPSTAIVKGDLSKLSSDEKRYQERLSAIRICLSIEALIANRRNVFVGPDYDRWPFPDEYWNSMCRREVFTTPLLAAIVGREAEVAHTCADTAESIWRYVCETPYVVGVKFPEIAARKYLPAAIYCPDHISERDDFFLSPSSPTQSAVDPSLLELNKTPRYETGFVFDIPKGSRRRMELVQHLYHRFGDTWELRESSLMDEKAYMALTRGGRPGRDKPFVMLVRTLTGWQDCPDRDVLQGRHNRIEAEKIAVLESAVAAGVATDDQEKHLQQSKNYRKVERSRRWAGLQMKAREFVAMIRSEMHDRKCWYPVFNTLTCDNKSIGKLWSSRDVYRSEIKAYCDRMELISAKGLGYDNVKDARDALGPIYRFALVVERGKKNTQRLHIHTIEWFRGRPESDVVIPLKNDGHKPWRPGIYRASEADGGQQILPSLQLSWPHGISVPRVVRHEDEGDRGWHNHYRPPGFYPTNIGSVGCVRMPGVDPKLHPADAVARYLAKYIAKDLESDSDVMEATSGAQWKAGSVRSKGLGVAPFRRVLGPVYWDSEGRRHGVALGVLRRFVMNSSMASGLVFRNMSVPYQRFRDIAIRVYRARVCKTIDKFGEKARPAPYQVLRGQAVIDRICFVAKDSYSPFDQDLYRLLYLNGADTVTAEKVYSQNHSSVREGVSRDVDEAHYLIRMGVRLQSRLNEEFGIPPIAMWQVFSPEFNEHVYHGYNYHPSLPDHYPIPGNLSYTRSFLSILVARIRRVFRGLHPGAGFVDGAYGLERILACVVDVFGNETWRVNPLLRSWAAFVRSDPPQRIPVSEVRIVFMHASVSLLPYTEDVVGEICKRHVEDRESEVAALSDLAAIIRVVPALWEAVPDLSHNGDTFVCTTPTLAACNSSLI